MDKDRGEYSDMIPSETVSGRNSTQHIWKGFAYIKDFSCIYPRLRYNTTYPQTNEPIAKKTHSRCNLRADLDTVAMSHYTELKYVLSDLIPL